MSAPIIALRACPLTLDARLRQALLARDLLPDSTGRLPADLYLLWLDPLAPQGRALLEGLRAEPALRQPVLVVVCPDASPDALAAACAAGADACTSATDPAQLVETCRLALASAERFGQASPLTGLPGSNALEREIERRLPHRGELAILAFDVDDFKSYNDKYGYHKGDGLLRFLGATLIQALNAQAADEAFAAHLGGDDFFALVRPLEAPLVARRVIELFERGRDEHYEPADRERAGIVVRTRSGQTRCVPLATLTVAAVTNEADDLRHVGQLAGVLAELKAYGKTMTGSNYVPDRRRVHDPEQAWYHRSQPERDEG